MSATAKKRQPISTGSEWTFDLIRQYDKEIARIAERYPVNEWNIYAAQASDGDNWNDDSPVCRDILINQIMPFVQYYTYVEITPREHQALWYEYERINEAFPDTFAQQQLVSAGDIYPVFRELFQRRLVT